jgi:hypothetical protein
MRIPRGETLERARKEASGVLKAGFEDVLGVARASEMRPERTAAIARDWKMRVRVEKMHRSARKMRV